MSKKAKTESKQNITTTTTTTLRDIGLTGAQAVDLASVLESGSIARAQINADLVGKIVQTAGSGVQSLVGGAGKMTDTAGQVAVAQSAKAPEITSFEKIMPFIALALLGTVYLTKKG